MGCGEVHAAVALERTIVAERNRQLAECDSQLSLCNQKLDVTGAELDRAKEQAREAKGNTTIARAEITVAEANARAEVAVAEAKIRVEAALAGAEAKVAVAVANARADMVTQERNDLRTQLEAAYKEGNATKSAVGDLKAQNALLNGQILDLKQTIANQAANYSNCPDSNNALEAELSSVRATADNLRAKLHTYEEITDCVIPEFMGRDNCSAIWPKIALQSINSKQSLMPCQVYDIFSDLNTTGDHFYQCRDLDIKSDDCQTMYDCILAGRQEISHEPC